MGGFLWNELRRVRIKGHIRTTLSSFSYVPILRNGSRCSATTTHLLHRCWRFLTLFATRTTKITTISTPLSPRPSTSPSELSRSLSSLSPRPPWHLVEQAWLSRSCKAWSGSVQSSVDSGVPKLLSHLRPCPSGTISWTHHTWNELHNSGTMR